MKTLRVALMIIDPQEDYMPARSAGASSSNSLGNGGAAAVPDAIKVFSKIAGIVETYQEAIGDIFVTSQSHHVNF